MQQEEVASQRTAAEEEEGRWWRTAAAAFSPTMGLALSLVYPELISFTSGTSGWSSEYEDGVALEEETCLLEEELLLMLCWLPLCEDTELGRPCERDTQKR